MDATKNLVVGSIVLNRSLRITPCVLSPSIDRGSSTIQAQGLIPFSNSLGYECFTHSTLASGFSFISCLTLEKSVECPPDTTITSPLWGIHLPRNLSLSISFMFSMMLLCIYSLSTQSRGCTTIGTLSKLSGRAGVVASLYIIQ